MRYIINTIILALGVYITLPVLSGISTPKAAETEASEEDIMSAEEEEEIATEEPSDETAANITEEETSDSENTDIEEDVNILDEEPKENTETENEAPSDVENQSFDSSAEDFDFLGSGPTEESKARQKEIKEQKEAAASARNLLEEKPEAVKLRQNQIKSLKKMKEDIKKKFLEHQAAKDFIKPTPEEEEENPNIEDEQADNFEIKQILDKLQPAPLGLYWGASVTDLKKIGLELKPAKRKDSENVYAVSKFPKPNNTFKNISAIFGKNDSLYAIYAESAPEYDNASADNVMELYTKYFNALKAKYGNAKEHFIPFKEEITKTINEKEETIIHVHEKGNSDFFNQLKDGKANLYATFGNNEISATLLVIVEDEKSFISLEYTNLKLLKKEKNTKTVIISDDIDNI